MSEQNNHLASIQALWHQNIPDCDVECTANLLEVGVTSIMLMKFLLSVKRETGVSVTIGQLQEHNTMANLSEHIFSRTVGA